MRASIFPARPVQPGNLNIWSLAVDQSQMAADQSQFAPIPQRTQVGPTPFGTLAFQIMPARVDVVLTGDPEKQDPGEVPAVTDRPGALAAILEIGTRATAAIGSEILRVALAVQVIAQTPDAEKAVAFLKSAVPGLPVDDTERDIIFQRLRRSLAHTGSAELNLIEKWSTVTLQITQQFIGPGVSQPFHMRSIDVVQLEIEANNVPQDNVSYRADDSAFLLSEAKTLVENLLKERIG